MPTLLSNRVKLFYAKSGVLHLCSVTIMGQSSIYLRENLSKWRRPFCDDNLCWTKRLQTVKTRWCKTQILSPLLSSSPLSLFTTSKYIIGSKCGGIIYVCPKHQYILIKINTLLSKVSTCFCPKNQHVHNFVLRNKTLFSKASIYFCQKHQIFCPN